MIQINFRDPRPIYEQVRDGFRRLITSGALAPDTRLPSVRDLAASLTINPNTIQRAYRELEAEGYTYSIPGKGSFVTNTDSAAQKHRAELLDRLTELARELRAAGASEEEIMAAITGGASK